MSTSCNCDAAAYVLGALEEHELSGFRAHLDSCAVCREEVASMRVVVDALPLAATQLRAPRALKRRVMSVVDHEATTARRAAESTQRERRAANRRWRPFPAFAGSMALVAAAAVVVLLASGALDQSKRSTTLPTRVISAEVSGGGSTGRAMLRQSGSHTELVVSRMPPPPARHIYQVWLRRPGQLEPSPTNALFNVASDGSATVDVPGSLRGVKAVLVTSEPIGGSRSPTGPQVITASLT